MVVAMLGVKTEEEVVVMDQMGQPMQATEGHK